MPEEAKRKHGSAAEEQIPIHQGTVDGTNAQVLEVGGVTTGLGVPDMQDGTSPENGTHVPDTNQHPTVMKRPLDGKDAATTSQSALMTDATNADLPASKQPTSYSESAPKWNADGMQRLREELTAFSQCQNPSPDIQAEKVDYILGATRVALQLFRPHYPHVAVVPFGSYANGLGVAASDIDLVVVGVMSPSTPSGYLPEERAQVARHLGSLRRQLQRNACFQKADFQLIRNARIPILKINAIGRFCTIAMDISLASNSGPAAATYMAGAVSAWPALRPVCLALKCMLKDKHLADVSQGGLSSFSLSHMVLASLMVEQQAGVHSTNDPAVMMARFLWRFGLDIDYSTTAISALRGGLCPKEVVQANEVNASMWYRQRNVGSSKICVEDPLTGRDVSSGTLQVEAIRNLFGCSYRKLVAATWATFPGDAAFPVLGR
ncbi:unnamed protein product [Ostreobium quekettii]|uniref:Poly(A) RNA polymerase mitochondrial-like central palm domain-containing protein n=1 Tax=Ostreobium quekettii TaxID=121088 RepID=A0A8S1IQQ7_9CHLO|nr:unnamed protein product [Ostreobium quekettii]